MINELSSAEPKLRHLTRSDQLTTPKLFETFFNADVFAGAWKTREGRRWVEKLCTQRYVLSFFGEESTRTRSSSELAALRLGAKLTSIAGAKQISSFAKGEPEHHAWEVFLRYEFDLLCLRWPSTTAADNMAAISDRLGMGSVMNCGSGNGEHPTQAGLDQYTVFREFGRLDDLTYVFVGDLANGRTVHSNMEVVSRFPTNRIIGVAHNEVALRTDDPLRKLFADRGIDYVETTDLMAATAEADVLYDTRIQFERIKDEQLKHKLRAQATEMQITNRQLDVMRPHAILMHPLPVDESHGVPEIAFECEASPRARMFQQSANGLPWRMAAEWDMLRWDDAV